MNARILVVYASRYGSTAEVAKAIADTLREEGCDAEAKPVKEARSLEGVDAVVIGAPIYVGSLLKDARAFLEKQRTALEALPVAIFALGPTSREDEIEGSRAQLDGELVKLSWFAPRAKQVFVGRYDPSRLRLADKALATLPAHPLHGQPARDDRDWTAIRDWAISLPPPLTGSGPLAQGS